MLSNSPCGRDSNSIPNTNSDAHEDTAQVDQLYQDLTAKGFKVWKDDYQLLPGENWEHKIEVALKEHEFVIVYLSAASVGKRGFFQVELKKAARKQAERSIADVYIISVKFNDHDVSQPLDYLAS